MLDLCTSVSYGIFVLTSLIIVVCGFVRDCQRGRLLGSYFL